MPTMALSAFPSHQTATSDKSSVVGALIADVTSGGGADKAGLKKGDVVTSFNGLPITDSTDLTAQVRTLAPGSTAKLSYVRGNDSNTVSVTLGTLKLGRQGGDSAADRLVRPWLSLAPASRTSCPC